MANEKILVIDDDPDLVEVMRLTLETQGYQVFSAAGGEQGLKAVKEIQPDGRLCREAHRAGRAGREGGKAPGEIGWP